MFEWWGCLVYCCFLGTVFGAAASHPAGWVFGLIIGFVVGTLPPVGAHLPFDPKDL